MVRYRKKVFITSFILSILIFGSGLFIGFWLDSYRSQGILDDLMQNELNTESYFISKQFVDVYGGKECEALGPVIENLKYLTGKIGTKLVNYDEKKMMDNNLDYLKRKYFLSEIKFLLLLDDLEKECEKDYDVILFFYTKDDEDSRKQGYVLNSLTKKYEDSLVILSFDKDYRDEPLIETLNLKYGIKESSTIIVNGIKKDNFVSLAEIEEIIS